MAAPNQPRISTIFPDRWSARGESGVLNLGKWGGQARQTVCGGDLLAIREEAQSPAPLVALAGLVVKDREPMAMVAELIQTEVIPGSVGYERMDFDNLIGAGAQADQTVAEPRQQLPLK